MKSWKLKRKDM